MKKEATSPSPNEQNAGHIIIPTFREAFLFWLKLGFISVGGPAGQIAIMQTELVEKRRWISQARFLHALNFCMLLPGPEAQQLAIYTGWLLHRTRGGLVAGALFVLPSMFILWALSAVYVAYGNVPWLAAIFYGLKPAVLAIVAAAVLRIGRKTLHHPIKWLVAAAAFGAIFIFHVPFPLVVLTALALGLVWRTPFAATSGAEDALETEAVAPSAKRAFLVLTIGLVLWWTPILLAGLWQGWDGTLFREGVFFSKAAVVTFGGAYAVLPYVAQQAVEQYGWLQTGQMMDGLGLAETTPGPLIMVLQFVGYLGGWNQPGNLPPFLSATLGAAMTTWATFVPCFIWIFLGAPYVERLRQNAKFAAALSAVMAAVVGVILNLAVWFGWHVIVPAAQVIDWFALILALLAFVGLVRWKWSVVAVLAVSGAAGLVVRLVV